MQIDNFHILTLWAWLLLSWWAAVLFYRNYILRERLKAKYTLLFSQSKYFYIRPLSLVLCLIIISLSIFNIHVYQTSLLPSWGQDIVIVLDVSKSMETRDIEDEKYSRLEYAKAQIRSYINSHPENRYSLVIFAGDALSMVPLTNNREHFFHHLSKLNYTHIGKQGTDLVTASELGYTRFGISEWDTGKALILISDGWDQQDTLDTTLLSSLNPDNIASFIFGVGTKRGGPIPIGQDPFWDMLFQTYGWQQVITTLNSDLLKDLAKSLGGSYHHITDFSAQLDTIQTKALQSSQDKHKSDISGVLALLGVILFVFYLLFPYTWLWRK